MRLQITEDNRFWETERNGKAVTTRWGKIGGKVQSATREFASEEKAEAFERSAIDEKRKQGYQTGADPALVEELLTKLRADPEDVEAALVLSDVWQAAGDPRGQVMAIEHAIRNAGDPARIEAMEDQLVRVMEVQRGYVFGKPGGYPFREAWMGRTFVAYRSDAWQTLRARTWEGGFKRVCDFLTQLTDAKTHASITPMYGNRELQGAEKRVAAEVQGYTHEATRKVFEKSLGPGTTRDLRMNYDFQLTYHDSDIRLPFQTSAFHAGGHVLRSSFEYVPVWKMFHLNLSVPFENGDDPAFGAYLEHIYKVLGKVFKGRKWFQYVLTKKNDGLKRGKKIRV